jgi:hypothetical protein
MKLQMIEILFILGIAIAASACDPGRCYGLGYGKRYRVTVVEPYTKESKFTQVETASDGIPPCPYWEVSEGDTFDIEIVGTQKQDACLINEALVVSASKPRTVFPGAATGPPLPVTDAQTVFRARSRIIIDECPGTWELVMQGHTEPISHEGNPYKTPVVGEPPPFTLHDSFRGDETDANCIAAGLERGRCSSKYVAVFQKIP